MHPSCTQWLDERTAAGCEVGISCSLRPKYLPGEGTCHLLSPSAPTARGHCTAKASREVDGGSLRQTTGSGKWQSASIKAEHGHRGTAKSCPSDATTHHSIFTIYHAPPTQHDICRSHAQQLRGSCVGEESMHARSVGLSLLDRR